MRKTIAAVTAAMVVALAACSGSEPLSPAPTTDRQGGTPSHDTAVVSGPTKPSSPPPVVASFALSGAVYGHEPGADTMQVVVVPNVRLTLVKVGEVTGDTLINSVTVASTTTDAQGAYRIENLPPAYYRVDVVPPVGSPDMNATSGVGPAREAEVKLYISLARVP
jgi:hypothetical protein